MKKIECKINYDTAGIIQRICKYKGYTIAEFNRRAIDFYIDTISKNNRVTLHSLNELSQKLKIEWNAENCGIEDTSKPYPKHTIGSIMLNGRKDLKKTLEEVTKEIEQIEKTLEKPNINKKDVEKSIPLLLTNEKL